MLNLLQVLVHIGNSLVFSILSRIFYNSFNKDLISKYFLFVLALSVIHSCWLELDYLVNPTQL